MASADPSRLRALILSNLPLGVEKEASERERFARFVLALSAGGLEAEHRFAGEAEELRRTFRASRPDLVFSASLASAPGPRGRVNMHALLEEEGLAYVGSDPAALELAIDKAALKGAWAARGIRTPAYMTAGEGLPLVEARAEAIGYPLIVKPSREGNSRGIDEGSIVRNRASLAARVGEIAGRFGGVLVERFLGERPGLREFTVAMIGSGDAMLAMPAEISFAVPKAVRVVTTADKEGGRAAALPVEDAALRGRVADFALAAFRAAGVRDYSRCDILLADGELHAIEINGQPMVPDPWFGTCASGAGMDETAYLNAIVLAALSRCSREGPRGLRIPDAMRDLVPGPVFEALAGRPRRSHAG